ncbi:glutaconate CoA-transferase subunit A [Crossiella equi]|uniref:Glutaconate CoA-transferase subunit A n=1 Tax=Crossiella equi TaxID=130796 RepID=A0ABS5A925_9PSEU|nr:CoA-transferase [Crossiella equi]MBP2473077.1 glutaconate CoA-transferase subunit A [Crossiella equi]
MRDKRMTADEAVAELRDGMTIGIGGWGSRRKPMALVRAVLRSELRDLTVVTYGGPDLGALCAAGRVRKAVYGFVSLDSIPYDPWFQLARQEGKLEVAELDEGMLQTGLRAAAHRLPFLPIRAGLASDVLRVNPDLRTVACPYTGQPLVAMPALPLDAAFVHLNLADQRGNARYLGPDPYFDDLFCLAARRRYVSVERVVSTEDLIAAGPPQGLLLNRMMVDGVIESPGGAAFTSCVPDYARDEAAQRTYATAARESTWESFVDTFLAGPR